MFSFSNHLFSPLINLILPFLGSNSAILFKPIPCGNCLQTLQQPGHPSLDTNLLSSLNWGAGNRMQIPDCVWHSEILIFLSWSRHFLQVNGRCHSVEFRVWTVESAKPLVKLWLSACGCKTLSSLPSLSVWALVSSAKTCKA